MAAERSCGSRQPTQTVISHTPRECPAKRMRKGGPAILIRAAPPPVPPPGCCRCAAAAASLAAAKWPSGGGSHVQQRSAVQARGSSSVCRRSSSTSRMRCSTCEERAGAAAGRRCGRHRAGRAALPPVLPFTGALVPPLLPPVLPTGYCPPPPQQGLALALNPSQTQLFRKPRCTSGRLPSSRLPSLGGCAIRQACRAGKGGGRRSPVGERCSPPACIPSQRQPRPAVRSYPSARSRHSKAAPTQCFSVGMGPGLPSGPP